MLSFTLRPAKNGSSTFFGVDHTFLGEVVNFADTLHDICSEIKGKKWRMSFFIWGEGGIKEKGLIIVLTEKKQTNKQINKQTRF